MDSRINPNIYPPGGRCYTAPDGTFFRADSWKLLEKRVREYLERRGVDTSRLETEIADQFCARHPNFCSRSAPARVLAEPSGMSFNQRIVQWLANIVQKRRLGTLVRVSDEERQRRAVICARCPRQQSLVKSCGACITNIERIRTAILDGRASEHQNLMECGVLGEDCQISVYLDEPKVSNGGLPAECWRRA